MAKKQTTMKGLGPRYGIKPRKQYTKIHLLLKAKRKCPDCGASLTRDSVGIWSCKKCSFKVAGTAYDVKL